MAFFNSLSEAIDIINKDKRAAAQLYLDAAKDTKNSVEDILRIISDKDYGYTLRPQKLLSRAALMAKIGSVKQTPASVADLGANFGKSMFPSRPTVALRPPLGQVPPRK